MFFVCVRVKKVKFLFGFLAIQSMTMSSENNIIDALIEANLYHIVEDIFLHLDCQSLTNAEKASPAKWRPFIQANSKLYHKKLATISSWFLINEAAERKKERPKRLLLTPIGTRTKLLPD